MGEEWNAAQPFLFFCNFSGELGKLVTEGRRREFAAFPEFRDAASRERIPDPEAESTFLDAKLDWGALHRPEHIAWLKWYQAVLAVRRTEIVPRMREIRRGGEYNLVAPGAVTVRWTAGDRQLVLQTNLSETPAQFEVDRGAPVIWFEGGSGTVGSLPPFATRWAIVGE
jgi:1,4-alpha-glucan branching enzyme